MRVRSAIVGSAFACAAASCSLTTSLSGLSIDEPGADAGATLDGADATVDAASDAKVEATTEAGSSGYRATVLADSPVAYYRFDDTGAVAKDETGAHDGTYKGAIAHVAGAIPSEPSNAASFDGSSYVDVGNILPSLGAAPFALEAWASPVAGASDPACLAAKTFAPGGASGNVSEGYTLYLDTGSNGLEFARFASGARSGPSGPGLANGRFTHVVATYDGTTTMIFVDGSLAASKASSEQVATTSTPLTIGAGRGGIYCYFHGALDEVVFYDVALPAQRIQAHYLAGIAK